MPILGWTSTLASFQDRGSYRWWVCFPGSAVLTLLECSPTFSGKYLLVFCFNYAILSVVDRILGDCFCGMAETVALVRRDHVIRLTGKQAPYIHLITSGPLCTASVVGCVCLSRRNARIRRVKNCKCFLYLSVSSWLETASHLWTSCSASCVCSVLRAVEQPACERRLLNCIPNSKTAPTVHIAPFLLSNRK